MRAVLTVVIGVVAATLAACTTVTTSQSPPAPSASSSATPSAPATSPPASTGAPASTTPQPGPTAPAGPTGVPASTTPNVTDPWAVVSAYYGDIESGNYAEAWALIGSGATTGQTYQQFVSGFACTGDQGLTEVGESGDQVTFDLAATDSCTGQVHDFTGTDTVHNGMIVAANVVQTG